MEFELYAAMIKTGMNRKTLLLEQQDIAVREKKNATTVNSTSIVSGYSIFTPKFVC